MAEKKVILKDGADELLPKTSASMVFTESGQTVENALKSAGGGGTGGIDEEQLSQYLSQHKYITQTALDEANYLKPTSAITGYSKASNYTALAPTDTLNEALGKLEAWIGSGGTGGGGDNIYWIPSDILNLESGDTYEEILAALGGSLDDIYEAVKSGKIFYSNTESTISYRSFCIDVFLPFMQQAAFFSFTVRSNISSPLANYEVYCNTSSPRESYVKIIYIEGYKLNTNICFLSSSSNTEDISTAVGGESGMKKIIQAVNDGNRLVIRDVSSKRNQDFLCSFCEKYDNGNMNIILSGIGYGLWGGIGGLLSISYSKTSNTFSCTLVPISMGS